MIWLGLGIGLLVGLIGGVFLGVWLFRRSMATMEPDDQDLTAMAKKMGVNLNPRQLQVVKQQMKKAGNNPPPLFGSGKKAKNKPKGITTAKAVTKSTPSSKKK
jgi:uncharacterized protein YneF (UPF0154 family)